MVMDETIYVNCIHHLVKCANIMVSNHLQLIVGCNFTYAIKGYLIICIIVTFFINANYSFKLNFFWVFYYRLF